MFLKRIALISFLVFTSFISRTDASEELESFCRNENFLNVSTISNGGGDGEDLVYFYIKLKDDGDGDSLIFDCSYFNVGPVRLEDFPKITDYSGRLLCSLPSDYSNLRNILNLESQVSLISEEVLCKDSKRINILSKECGKELGCNLLRSLINVSTLSIYSRIAPYLKNEDTDRKKSCLNSTQSDCMSEVGAGIIKNIWANIEGVGYLLKSVASYTWKGIKGFTESLFGGEDAQEVEDKSSDAMLMAGAESESSIKKFIRNPSQFMVDLGVRIYEYLMKTAADNFACEEWSGAPHTSFCKKHLDSWECSSCNQRVNALCGVLGFAGGEVVTAFLTGGTINLLGKAGRATGVANAFSQFSRTTIGSKVVTTSSKAGGYLGNIISYPFKMLEKIPGVRQYLHATESAFLSGLRRKNHRVKAGPESIKLVSAKSKNLSSSATNSTSRRPVLRSKRGDFRHNPTETRKRLELSKDKEDFHRIYARYVRNNPVSKSDLDRIQKLFDTLPLREANRKAFDIVLNHELKILNKAERDAVMKIVQRASVRNHKRSFQAWFYPGENGNGLISLTMPQKFNGTALQYVNLVHETTHAIQMQLLSNIKGWKLSGSKRANYYMESGAMSSEFKMLEAIPIDERKKLLKDIRDITEVTGMKSTAISMMASTGKSPVEHVIYQHKYGRYPHPLSRKKPLKVEGEFTGREVLLLGRFAATWATSIYLLWQIPSGLKELMKMPQHEARALLGLD